MTNIEKYRKQAGLTQAELAEAVGYSAASAVCMWESGARRVPSDKLVEIARLLHCTVDELLETKEEE